MRTTAEKGSGAGELLSSEPRVAEPCVRLCRAVLVGAPRLPLVHAAYATMVGPARQHVPWRLLGMRGGMMPGLLRVVADDEAARGSEGPL